MTGTLFHPSEPDLFYVKTDVGGMYRWQESSRSWKQLLQDFGRGYEEVFAVESIAVHPSDPDKLYFAGNDQLFISNDRGDSWAETNFSYRTEGNSRWRFAGERLAVDPRNSNVIYYGTMEDGLVRSLNGGGNWGRRNDVPLGDVVHENFAAGVTTVLIDGRTGQNGRSKTVIAATAGQGIWRSNDAGNNFSEITGGSGEPANGLVPIQARLSNGDGIVYVSFVRANRDGNNNKRINDDGGFVFKYFIDEDRWENITPVWWGGNWRGGTQDGSVGHGHGQPLFRSLFGSPAHFLRRWCHLDPDRRAQ